MTTPFLIPVLIVMAVIVLGIVVLPLIRRGTAAASTARFDRAVYRDQLQEVDRDLARGVLNGTEAASARLEIERRLLATDSVEKETAAPRRSRRLMAAAIALIVAVWAAGFYMILGAPGVPDLPFADRAQDAVPSGHADVEDAAARLEQRLKSTGGDADGWMLLARTETGLRHWDKSAEAYRHVLELAPDRAGPSIHVAYGETLTLAARGIVTPPARDAFRQTLASEPANPVARFYLALVDAQSGDDQSAISAWLKLAGELPAASDMRAEIERRVAAAAQEAGIAAPALPPPAPSRSGN